MKEITYLTIKMQHCSLDVAINDIVLLRKHTQDILSIATPIHEYLINQGNELMVDIHKLTSGFNESSSVHIRVAAYEEGGFLTPDEGRTLTEIIFNYKDQKLPLKISYKKKAHFHSNSDKRWAWELAPTIKLNNSWTKKASDFIKSLQADIQNQNTTKVSALYSHTLKEKAFCYPMLSIDDRIRNISDLIVNQFNFIEIDDENIAFKLAAQGRLIECIGKDGLPLIRTFTDKFEDPFENKDYMALPMHIGLINNKFAILR